MKLNGWYKKNDHGSILLIHYIIKNNTSIIDIKIIQNNNKISGKYLQEDDSGELFWKEYSQRDAQLLFINEISSAFNLF